jgi:hypothetical protein
MKLKLVLLNLILFLNASVYSQEPISVDSLKKHVYTLADDSFEGRSIGTKGGDRAAQYIVQQFELIGIKPLLTKYYHHFVYHTHAQSAEGKNVIGLIEGSHPELKNEYIVIGAHYDHVGYYFKDGKKIIYNGADDNASGVAGVIELARAIYNNQSQFERSIILVAFDGEETGLNGSKWFVKDSLIPASQIKLMLSIDMIGMLSKNEGVELYGTGSFKNADLIAQQTASKINLVIKKNAKAVSAHTDTKPFGDVGIPAIHVFTGTVSPYHEPEDDADLLDYQGMALISNFIYDFVLRIASTESEQLVSTLPGEVKPPIIKVGARLNVGASMQNYPDEFYKSKNGFALQSGVYAHINISKRVALQPELLYETLGSKNAVGNFRTHAVTAPVNILFRLVGNNEMETWLHFVAGGYYTYNFAGKNGSSNIDYQTQYDPYEYGANLGFALNISSVQIGITKKVGLTNLYQDSNLANIKNEGLFCTLGYTF